MFNENNVLSPVVDAALERICEVANCAVDDLQGILNISRQAFSAGLGKATLPKSWAKKIQDKYSVNSEWILTGEGERTMSQFHQQLGNEVNDINDLLITVLKKMDRYGVTAKEGKLVNKMRAPITELKHLLDERAFRECLDLPEDRRTKLYYQHEGTAERIQVVDLPNQPTISAPVAAKPIPEATPGILASGRTIPLIGLAECGVEGWSTQMEGMAATTQVPDVHEDMIAALAIGDSMEPAGIKPGNVIFADPRLTPNPGDIVYVVRRDGLGEGTATVKIYQGETDGWLELCGWLPKKHSENGQKEFCIKEKLEYVEVVAPVVMIRKRAE
ncbi:MULTISPECIES: LexA family transcriptional regulator [unclassified Maridesulfovibrio]|uniref:LexA family transcriptional regulator n=1 Tax=unclassified Maridesulfovibrio TaxID=2794999 RepID=UPI003B41F5E7